MKKLGKVVAILLAGLMLTGTLVSANNNFSNRSQKPTLITPSSGGLSVGAVVP
ncbi:MAG: hypothetical protein SFU83_23405 [Meiothermus sp.]|nr:hypothetical protein [Meiothermus sp.]